MWLVHVQWLFKKSSAFVLRTFVHLHIFREKMEMNADSCKVLVRSGLENREYDRGDALC
jgi:hypothetical protein